MTVGPAIWATEAGGGFREANARSKRANGKKPGRVNATNIRVEKNRLSDICTETGKNISGTKKKQQNLAAIATAKRNERPERFLSPAGWKLLLVYIGPDIV